MAGGPELGGDPPGGDTGGVHDPPGLDEPAMRCRERPHAVHGGRLDDVEVEPAFSPDPRKVCVERGHEGRGFDAPAGRRE